MNPLHIDLALSGVPWAQNPQGTLTLAFHCCLHRSVLSTTKGYCWPGKSSLRPGSLLVSVDARGVGTGARAYETNGPLVKPVGMLSFIFNVSAFSE